MTEPYKTKHSRPEGIEWELLLILMEECNEVSQRASKAMRFGATEVQPEQDLDNVQRLSMELGDLLHVMDRLRDLGYIDDKYVEAGKKQKAEQLKKFLQNQ